MPSIPVSAEAAAAPAVLSLSGLTVTFDTPRGRITAARDVTLAVERGECLGVVGESGAGKSQVFLAVLGLLAANGRAQGSARFLGTELLKLAPAALDRVRGAGIGMVFQDPMTSLTPHLTVGGQIAEVIRRHRGVGRAAAHATALTLLERVQVSDPERRMRQYPHELSGGMRQRVLIAMALLLDPRIIILDEPTTALDILTQRAIIDLLRELRGKLGFATIFISHDLSIAAELADRMLTMYAGRIVERATVEDLFYRPRHPYSVGLMRAVPRVSGALGSVASIPGSPPDLIRLPRGCSYYPRCPFHVDECLQQDPPLLRVDTPDHEAACIRWETVAAALGSDAEAPVAEKLA